MGSLRADDWGNLERGSIAFSPQWLTIWTTLNQFTLYRPLVDVWHGSMLGLFGLEPRPMLVLLVGQLLLQSWLLSRLVRSLGSSRATAALAGLAVWAQPNTYSWTTLWVSNATGSLMTTFALVALVLLVRAVRLSTRGRSSALTLIAMNFALVASALCKEEAVLLPGIALALAATRWRSASGPERRAWMSAIGSLLVFAATYALFRTQVFPTPQVDNNRYALRLGSHVLRNLAFFAVHLGAMPILTLTLARVWMPAAFTREARDLPDWPGARDSTLGGLAWTLIACTLYLAIGGRPAYGYLYAPAMGIAFATANALTFAHRAHGTLAASPRQTSPVTLLLVHSVLCLAVTAFGLFANGWHRFGVIQREALATLHREVPDPPPGTMFVFVDPGKRETLSGRSLFSLVFEGAPASMLRLSYARDDLQSRFVEADDVDLTTLRAGTWVFRAEAGVLVKEAVIP